MNVYALLIGINDYPGNRLYQCVNDVEKMTTYLKGIKHKTVGRIEIKPLKDQEATKENIVNEISAFLGQAGDDDVALMYYSGHGGQENAGGRFADEHDGLLDCLVCYSKADQESGYLLANKEIRYLFSEFENNPHLVTVFDCCHSGDMTRTGPAGNVSKDKIRRLSGHFSPREYSEFIFHKAISPEDLKTKPLAELIRFRNNVHIAASTSGQSSWEDDEGGVFTRYLLQLLKAQQNRITYQEIARWAKLSLKDVTDKAQTPTIRVQGKEGDKTKINAFSPWLNLHKDLTGETKATIGYNENNGWYLSMGQLMGIKPDTEVSVDLAESKVDFEVESVEMDKALLKAVSGNVDSLDVEKVYPATVSTVFSTLSIYVNNLDGEAEDKDRIEQVLKNVKNVELGQRENARFYANIFNQMVYFSLPDSPYKPLTRQINLLEQEEENFIPILKHQLSYIIKWNHYDTLDNPGDSFEASPIKIEIQLDGEEEWHDVTNTTFQLKALEGRLEIEEEEVWIGIYKVKVTNISKQNLHVGVLSLTSRFGIFTDPWDDKVIELKKGASKIFYDHYKETAAAVRLESYQEVYNWPYEWVNYKFIVNNYEDFSASLPDFVQPSLDKPLMISRRTKRLTRSTSKDVFNLANFRKFRKQWGTVSTSVQLINPEQNLITGNLDACWDDYMKSEEMGPFIGRAYLSHELYGFQAVSDTIPNRTGKEVSRLSFNKVKRDIGNFLDNQRRKRKFKRSRKRMIDKPVIIAEGDSWFLYPFLLKDIIDNVMKEYPVLSIASAGDELQNYKKDGQLLAQIPLVRPKYVLISGGGNDVIGPEIQHILKENIGSGRAPGDYLNDKFEKNMAKLKGLYEYFIAELKKHDSVEKVFLHGYDYIRVDEDKFNKNGWVNKYMIKKGMTALADRERVIKHLVDTFNDILKDLSENDPFVEYLDLRGKVLKGQWYDEIHPDNAGFATIGKAFLEAL